MLKPHLSLNKILTCVSTFDGLFLSLLFVLEIAFGAMHEKLDEFWIYHTQNKRLMELSIVNNRCFVPNPNIKGCLFSLIFCKALL